MASICQTRTITKHYPNTAFVGGINCARTKAKTIQNGSKIGICVYKLKGK